MDTRGNTCEGADGKGRLWSLNQKLDEPIDVEAERISQSDEEKMSTVMLLQLSFQSLGIVYGDLGTSPLYVFYNTFPHGIKNPEDVIGVLSLIIYSLTLVTLLKYVLIICRANDNGHGGTFALYSLLCRHSNIRTLPNQDQTDEELTTYSRSTRCEKTYDARTRKWLERSAIRKNALLIIVLVGSCLVIGDGILTPAISVLSAVGGFKLAKPMSDEIVVIVSVIILIGLFSMQRCGTEKVGWLFAPIILLWLFLLGGIGIFNLCKHGFHALKAFSPVYIYRYLTRGGREGWASVGGVLLCITGTEALFADISQFPVSAIQIAFTVVVFPCLLLAYIGQGAYLLKNPNHVGDVFYRSVPDGLYWPVLVIATGAAIVASQSVITATFSTIKQALAHGCFPRVKVVHTSEKFQRQIYIPDINWMLMVLCVAVTAGFQKQSQIGTAFGTAVVLVMMVTTFLMVLIMILVWHSHWALVLLFMVLSLVVEGPYFISIIFKIDQGGWVPLAIAAAFFITMYSWHYATVQRYEHEMHSTVSLAWILSLGPSLGLVQVPGVGFVYTELASGVPRIFSHWITHLPAIHSVLVFVCIKYLPVCTVHEQERFLVKRIGPRELHMFRCVVRYGYKDLHEKDDEFEGKLLDSLLKFVRLEYLMEGGSDSDESSEQSLGIENSIPVHPLNNHHTFSSNAGSLISSTGSITEATSTPRLHSISATRSARLKQHQEIDEIEFLTHNRDAGVVHILGNTVVQARKDSSIFKKIAIDYIYYILKKICRGNRTILHVPQESSLRVGQIIYV